MDEIHIDNLKIFAHHGVYPEETANGQNFFVNAVLYTDTRPGGLSDDLTQTTNYGQVCLCIHRFLQEHTYQLLEAAAEHTVQEILRTFPLVQAVELELCKPDAPIPLDFGSVSVKIRRGWHRVYLALGSNLGDKASHLQQALASMGQNPDIRIRNVSSFLVTAPYGGVEQDDFLNGAAEIDTLLPPEELLDYLHTLEAQARRERLVHWGPRTLDLDILFYDQQIIRTPRLTVPHPDLQNRDFVLRPMAEIAPQWEHPLLRKTILQLLEALETT